MLVSSFQPQVVTGNIRLPAGPVFRAHVDTLLDRPQLSSVSVTGLMVAVVRAFLH